MKKYKLLTNAVLSGVLHAWDRLTRSDRSIALANELGGIYEHGRETLQIDPAAPLPVNSKYLVYQRGSSQYYAKPSNGTQLPLGISPDAPYQAGDFLDIERFGAARGTLLGTSSGAVSVDDLVIDAGAAIPGAVGGLTTAGHGTFWVIGRATKTVAAASQEITFIPCFPYTVSQ